MAIINNKQIFSAYDGKEDPDKFHFKICPFCGTQLTLKDAGGKTRPACLACGFIQYRNPLPGVVVLIEEDGFVLLGKRNSEYGSGLWCLPQGFIEYEEDFLSAAIREVNEETGLEVEIQTIINVTTNFLAPGLHTLAVILQAVIVAGEPCAGDDMATLEWFPLNGPLPALAFEADGHIIERYRVMKLECGLPVDPNFSMSK
jgi:8-oxo-dGTP diphosphatase